MSVVEKVANTFPKTSLGKACALDINKFKYLFMSSAHAYSPIDGHRIGKSGCAFIVQSFATDKCLFRLTAACLE